MHRAPFEQPVPDGTHSTSGVVMDGEMIVCAAMVVLLKLRLRHTVVGQRRFAHEAGESRAPAQVPS